MNRTLIEKVRCLLSNAALPYSFWYEASMMASYLVNRSPSTAIEKKTPQEVWFGSPTDYSVIKIFGCAAYVHVDKEKLAPRSVKCVFLGFKPGVKGYKLWCLEDKKVIYSRDVVFDEAAMLMRPSHDKEDVNYQPSQDSHAGTSHVEV